MSCLSEITKAMDLYEHTGRLKRSLHQQTGCKYCEEDASKYNHCSWCGATFKTMTELGEHLTRETPTAV